MNEFQRDMGRMESKLESLTKAVDKLTTKVENIESTLSEAKGGWRVLMLVSGASAAVGGLIVKIIPWLSSVPK